MYKYKPYPKYKDSGVEWLGEVPSLWDTIQFRRITSLQQGLQISQESRFPEGNDTTIEYITIKALHAGNERKNKEYINKPSIRVQCDIDDVLLARTGATGEVVTNVKGVFHNNFFKINYDRKRILRNYLVYLLKVKELKNHLLMLAGTTTIPDLNHGAFLGTVIPLPSLEKQQIITNYLDKATAKIDTLIQKQTKLIELLREKRQALISTAVTRGFDSSVAMKDSGVEWLGEIPEHWDTHRIDWVNTIVRGNTGFNKDELLDNGKYVALQYGKTYKVDEVNETFKFYVNDEFYKLSQVVHHGDTILISTSETVEDLGHSCFYNRDDLGLIGGEQILLKPNTKLVFEKYLYYCSKIFSSELKKYSTGLKVFRFNIDDLKNIFISLPSLQEQEEIANYIDDKTSKIDILITKATKAIELLKERRTVLISAVVTGKIDVR
ncbi:restriction endonuclease subunit S [Sulfurimonas sp. NWX79]|uniref:restriction endonuclease subunit S n=1 Tax=Sulfurimonas sp. NWX79 TaxID=2925412 RepID=UPI003204DE54